MTAPILTKPFLGTVKEALESDHSKRSCSEIIPQMVFPQMSTTEATRDQPHLWSLDKYTSQTLPFSPPPLSCSHTATSSSSSEFQESCSTCFGVTQAWVQQHELLHVEHSDQGRSLLEHVWHLLGPPPKTKLLHHPSHPTRQHWVEPQGLKDDGGSPCRSQGHFLFSRSPQSLPSSRLTQNHLGTASD